MAEPVAVLDARFSSANVGPADWGEASWQLEGAEVFWLSTVRPDGRPHVTPVLSVWLDGSMYFCTGHHERKARNLANNPHCILTTGRNALDGGLDVVVEGKATKVSDDGTLHRVAAAYESKYGSDWNGVRDAGAVVYRVTPSTAFGFAKGRFGQTRWSFGTTC